MSLAGFAAGWGPVRAAVLPAALLLFLAVLLWPQAARANVVCSLTNEPVTLAFGTSLTASAEIGYSCRSFNSTPTTFTLCTSRGIPSFPGTDQQPAMQSGGSVLAFNVYVDPGATLVWTPTRPIGRSVTILPGATARGSLTFYGRITAGQRSPVGSYQAFFFNTVLGFLSPDGRTCLPQRPDLNGVDFTLFVTAAVPEACTLGTIEAIDFGTPPGLWLRADAAGGVQVSCPSSVAWTLAFDAGLHAAAGERRMQSEDGNFVAYRLYRDSARAQAIGIDAAVAGIGSGTVQSIPVYGRIDVPQPPPAGIYTDTVIVVLRF